MVPLVKKSMNTSLMQQEPLVAAAGILINQSIVLKYRPCTTSVFFTGLSFHVNSAMFACVVIIVNCERSKQRAFSTNKLHGVTVESSALPIHHLALAAVTANIVTK
jgi:hypothetical protein